MLSLALQAVAGLNLSKAVQSGATSLAKEALKQATSKALQEFFATKRNLFVVHDGLTNALFAIESDPAQQEELGKFLRSETFGVFLQSTAFAFAVDPETRIAAQRDILFSILKQIFQDVPDAILEHLAKEIIDYALESSRQAWQFALEQGRLEPGVFATASAQSLATDGLAASFKKVEELQNISGKVLLESDALAQRYRDAIELHFAKIRPQSWQGTEEAPIKDIYVEPSLVFVAQNRILPRDRVSALSDFFRGVLLGNPGGGKSTFAGKLCFDLCNQYGNIDISGRSLTPFFITLRDYSRFRKDHPCSITEYLAVHSRTDYQVPAEEDFFTLMLLSGRALVVFDGLDELTETTDRVSIRDTVEHFAHAFPAAAILVTSREVGYEKAPLDRNRFVSFKLAGFDSMQVLEYASKWFSLTRQGSDEEKQKIISAFMDESALIPDIRSNPLMLGLLCNLYRQDGYLPKNRPDVYMRCADLLFTRWDKHRGISIQLPMESKLRPAMSFLANWIYSDEKLAAGVPERRLISATAEYIGRWREDQDEAVAIATEFVEFFKGRAWVFTDIGSDKDESLYAFTHRTFLEFFTAEQIVKSHPDALHLFDYLFPRIQRREWDVVCQLCFQLHSKNMESHDVLGEQLLRRMERATTLEERLTLASFSARVLDLIYPTPKLRRSLVRECFAIALSNIVDVLADTSEANLSKLIVENVSQLVKAPKEERKLTAAEIEEVASQFLLSNEKPVKVKQNALLMIETLSLFLHAGTSTSVPQGELNFWDGVTNDVLGKVKASCGTEIETDVDLSLLAWARQDLDMMNLWRVFGNDIIFQAVSYPFVGWYRYAALDLMLTGLLTEAGQDESLSSVELAWYKQEAFSVSEGFRRRGLPLRHRVLDPRLTVGVERLRILSGAQFPENADASDVLLLLLAIYADLERPAYEPGEINPQGRDLQQILDFTCAKSQPERRENAQKVLERCSNTVLREFLSAWIEGEVVLVLPHKQPNEVEGPDNASEDPSGSYGWETWQELRAGGPHTG